MDHTPILDLLRCPRCQAAALRTVAGGLTCGGCRLGFPDLCGGPWLYADPPARLVEWRNLTALRLDDLDRQIRGHEHAARGVSGPGLDRLGVRIRALRHNRDAIRALLAPLAGAEGAVDAVRAFIGKAAGTQTLAAYADTVFRDWGWPDGAEAETAAAMVVTACRAASAAAPDVLLVAGSGAGRLAFDTAVALSARRTVTLDINPFLVAIAARVYAGGTFDLHEFPLSPATPETAAVNRTLRLPATATPPPAIHPLYGDILNAPLRPDSVDLLVCPWLIDILPEAADKVLARLNQLVKPGGTLVFFGPAAFEHGGPERRLTTPEILSAIGGAGFSIVHERSAVIPYLCSPDSGQSRHERVLAAAARKTTAVAPPPPFQGQPDWIVDPRQPIPRAEGFADAALTHGLYAEVLALIDGRRSAVDLTAALAPRYQTAPPDFLGAMLGFLAGVYELNRR